MTKLHGIRAASCIIAILAWGCASTEAKRPPAGAPATDTPREVVAAPLASASAAAPATPPAATSDAPLATIELIDSFARGVGRAINPPSKWVRECAEWSKAACACTDEACANEMSKELSDMTTAMGTERAGQSDIDAIIKSVTMGTTCITAIAARHAGKHVP